MADINILVDSSQVRSAKQELQDLGNSFNSASKSASIFMQAFERAAKQSQRDEQYIRQTSQALQRLINDNLKITNAYKSAEESAAAFTKGLREQEAQALKTARANQDAFNRQLGVSGTSATQGGAGFGALESEIEQLRQKYDQIYASSQLYERSLQELNRAHMLGVTSAKQHEAAVESLNAEYQAFQNGAAMAGNRFAEHINQTASGMNQFGVVIQQAGYQVGDFLVQVQSGTNWMVALGQQATQLVGVLPLMGAGFMGLSTGALVALSAGLGIAIPLVTAIGAAWMRSTEESDKATSSVNKQAQAYQTLLDRIEELQLKRQMEASGLQTSEEQLVQNEVNQLLKEQADLRQQIAELSLQASSKGFVEVKNNQDTIRLLQQQIEERQAKLDIIAAEQQAEEMLARMAQIRGNTALEEIADRERLKQIHAEQVQAMGEARNEQRLMTIAAQEALDKYSKMRTVAAGLADELARGADETFRMSSLNYGKIQNTAGSGPDAARSEVWANMPNPFGVLAGGAGGVRQYPSSGGSGGGGGSAAQTTVLENKMEEIYRYLELDKYLMEQETIAYEQRQDVLRTALDNKLITLEEYNQLEKDLMSKHYLDLANIENQAQMSKLSTVLGAGEQILQALGQHNEKAAKMARVFGAAQALADTYAGAAAALKLPFPGNLAAAARIISAGLGFVAAIKSGNTSAKPSAGGIGTSRGSATVAPTTATAPTPQTVFIDSIDPKNLYSGETLINLFEALYDENDRRGKVFVVAR